MADCSNVADVLKRFATKITTSSVKERQKILSDLLPCVRKKEIAEPAVKGILRVLLMTLSRYNDRRSRLAVEAVLAALATDYFESLCNHVITVVGDVAELQKKAVPCVSTSAAALNALGWLCIIMRIGYRTKKAMKGEAFTKLVEMQGLLLYGALAAHKPRLAVGAHRRLKRTWKEVEGSVDCYAEVLTKFDANPHHLCLVSSLLKHLSAVKEKEKLKQYKSCFLNQYVKLVLVSRTKLALHLLVSCRELVRYVTRDEFKETLLPAIDRAMLRNPEIILEVVSELLAGLTIDLSPYAVDIGKHLATQCHSKDEIARKTAADASEHLAKLCSDCEAVEKLVRHFFDILSGATVKLTVVEQRLGMLSGIGRLSNHTVSGTVSVQSLTSAITECFIPILQQEVHEGTLVTVLATLALWCVNFTTEVPTKLTEWFKKGIGLKTSTSTVRNAYIQCMSAAFHGDTLIQGVPLLSLLLQLVEKANSQPSQVALATEALSAACLLLKLSLADIQAEQELSSLWKVLLDTNKQLFVNDKFLSSISHSALCSVATLVEKLVLDHPHKMDATKSGPYYRALVFCLTHGSYVSRRHAHTSTKKILAALGGATIALQLLSQFHTLLDSQKLVDVNLETVNGFTETTIDRYVSPRILAEAVICLATVPAPEVIEAEQIAMETLVDTHHPCIVHYDQDVWTNIVRQLKIDAADFIAAYIDDIITDLKSKDTVTQQLQNTVTMLARVSPSSALPKIVDYVEELLSSPALLTVTMEEVAIMNYPEGQLYNTSVIKSTDQQDNKMANMKRENKLYSYAEQLAEIELKKELERKKKGKADEPKLTKRQQEAIEAELEKEQETRTRVQQLDRRVKNAYALIEACCHGNAAMLRLHLPAVLKVVVSLFSSCLAASHMTRIFVELHQCAFSEAHKFFGYLVAYSTLRHLKPSCPLDSKWTEEPLRKQLERVIDQIHVETVSVRTGDQKEAFSAPTFAYCFYLLRAVLQDGGANVGGDEDVMVKALDVLEAHTVLRSDPGKAGIDENGPELLPREAMLKLCMNVIGVTIGKIQQMAARCVKGTAACASGLEGCAMAEQCEVNVLLRALLSVVAVVRESAIQGLLAMVEVLPSPDVDRDTGLNLVRRVWIARFDIETEIVALADSLWDDAELALDPEICSMIVSEDVINDETVIREAASRALVAALADNRGYAEAILKQLLALYEEKLYMPPPVLDNFGRPVGDTAPDQWLARCGVATAIGSISPYLSKAQILPLFRFFVDRGLGDRNEEVGRQMLAAAVAALNEHGKTSVNVLLPIFEDFLGQAPDTASFDIVRQSIVILMGSLAKHLDKDDPKVKPIVAKLINTLSTPSQQVQQAVADCLPPLVPAIKEGAPELVKQLLHLLLESESYGERRGAAYGLAGLVKGLGILVLKNLEIQPQLTDAIQDKKNPRRREGALFAFEMLCIMLGRLFEPYVVNILPHLLLCFGDANQYVRVAADDTAKAVMSKLSGHGVKLVLPSLLAGLEKDSWRTKTGSVELLGAMAYCAPKQLSGCLPSIVPKLAEVLTDSHIKVQKAGAQALKQIGSVIRNPEIQAIVPILLAALQDPTKKTTSCLQRLLETKFVHFIDAPSLALIMPVVQRAFLSRSTETRKMAAQIIGNMYSLTDQKDLAPYLPQVIPGLKQSLLDPVPEVRTVSAKALGTMVRGMGESGFKELDELVPWLMQTLTSEASSVDRSGAAQGLSEVVGGLGLEKLHKLMPDIIQTAERTDIAPTVRDGYIMMYIYLPAVFGDDFMSYIAIIIPSILKALADESEFVRDTALRAGQRIVNTYADSAVELLLPELENGLFNDNWRIRYSSVQLLGDLLYRLSGVTGKMSTQTLSEDDNFGTELSQQAILRVLGSDRRNRVLAGLYMGRSDTALNVRQAALHVWKVVVAHTPKTLREILPTLFQLLLGCLASKSYDKRQVAARTLGDIVRKLGEKVLPEIIPILERGLESDESDQRQGVCIGLSEIMSSTSRDHVLIYADSLVPTVSKALIDPLPEVRQAAADTFSNLHANIGQRALEDILPVLLRKLNDPDLSEYALDGLKQVMAVKSRVVLPMLVPQLTTPPVNTRALSFLASVAGVALNNHLHRILPSLMKALADKIGTPDEQTELQYSQSVVLSIADDAGIKILMDELLMAMNSVDKTQLHCAAVTILHSYCAHTKTDYSDYMPLLLRAILRLFTYTDKHVLNASWMCLNAITKKLGNSEMLGHVGNVRQALRFAVSDFQGDELPGFCLPSKGITPILPIFREAILNGPPEMKESAAIGLGEVIKRTSADALRPSVVHITGPLIRILGDRFIFGVKVALLETLALLLGKCGAMLKPFLPQLQTTFMKALNDPHRTVRLKAALALSRLAVIHTRVDPLFGELHVGVKNTEDQAVRDTMLQALRGCIEGAGSKMGDKVRKELTATLESLLSVNADVTRTTAAACLGAMCGILTDEELMLLLNLHLLDTDTGLEWTVRHGRSVALSIALKDAAQRLMAAEWGQRVVDAIFTNASADRVPICLSGLRGIGYLISHQVAAGEPVTPSLITAVIKTMKHDSNDVKQLGSQVVSYVAQSVTGPLDIAIIRSFVPMLVNGTKEKNTVVKTSSETALVSLLRLRTDDTTLQMTLNALEPGMKDALNEVMTKTLRKITSLPEPSPDDIDETILI